MSSIAAAACTACGFGSPRRTPRISDGHTVYEEGHVPEQKLSCCRSSIPSEKHLGHASAALLYLVVGQTALHRDDRAMALSSAPPLSLERARDLGTCQSFRSVGCRAFFSGAKELQGLVEYVFLKGSGREVHSNMGPYTSSAFGWPLCGALELCSHADYWRPEGSLKPPSKGTGHHPTLKSWV